MGGREPGFEELPKWMRQVADKAGQRGFERWHQMVAGTGGCTTQPIRLVGDSMTVDTSTGEVLDTYSTRDEPTEYLLVACGNRRASRCELGHTCSATAATSPPSHAATPQRSARCVPTVPRSAQKKRERLPELHRCPTCRPPASATGTSSEPATPPPANTSGPNPSAPSAVTTASGGPRTSSTQRTSAGLSRDRTPVLWFRVSSPRSSRA
jgi:hypothetical protein